MLKSLVKSALLLQFFILSSSSTPQQGDESLIDLPSIWEDENVTRMVREVIARDLQRENESARLKRQYKRDLTSKASNVTQQGEEEASQKSFRQPTKVIQTKNRVSATTRASVRPTVSPVMSNANFGSLHAAFDANKNKATIEPTKYHYYPHNQQPYFLPECAIQQVCNAVYVRLNYTQPLCVCPPRYRDPCSASLNEDDDHTITLIGNANKRAVTLAKTCEQGKELRDCRAPRDWSILALQNTRTGKSHYLVICKCPNNFKLEGPLPHDQPTYAALPGINVFGMLCVPNSAQTPAFGKWHARPVIHTSYRSKNTTIEAATSENVSSGDSSIEN